MTLARLKSGNVVLVVFHTSGAWSVIGSFSAWIHMPRRVDISEIFGGTMPSMIFVVHNGRAGAYRVVILHLKPWVVVFGTMTMIPKELEVSVVVHFVHSPSDLVSPFGGVEILVF